MAPILIEVVFEHVSGLPEDRMINTWAFLTPTLGYVESEAQAASQDLHHFYAVAKTPNVNPVDFYLSGVLARTAGAVTHRVYDLTGHLDGTPHGSPKNEFTYTLNAAQSGFNLPAELAACLSFHAFYGSDPEFGPIPPGGGARPRPRARDRGRVYIGPLLSSVNVEESVTEIARLSSAFRTVVANQALWLMNEPDHAWAVWSRSNAILEPVVGGWIDDAFDIQRRRGEAASSRTTWGT